MGISRLRESRRISVSFSRMRWPLLALTLVPPTIFAGSGRARADTDATPLHAGVACDHAAAAGRLRCDVELRARDAALRWADVEVVDVTEFIVPLRGRAGPREATTHEDDLWRWGLGLVARDRGEGDVTVRVRAVVCRREECDPEETIAHGHVIVGR
jgi:hypothetical protein